MAWDYLSAEHGIMQPRFPSVLASRVEDVEGLVMQIEVEATLGNFVWKGWRLGAVYAATSSNASSIWRTVKPSSRTSAEGSCFVSPTS